MKPELRKVRQFTPNHIGSMFISFTILSWDTGWIVTRNCGQHYFTSYKTQLGGHRKRTL